MISWEKANGYFPWVARLWKKNSYGQKELAKGNPKTKKEDAFKNLLQVLQEKVGDQVGAVGFQPM